MRAVAALALVTTLALVLPRLAAAQMFDVEQAAAEYLSSVTSEFSVQSDAYTEGLH